MQGSTLLNVDTRRFGCRIIVVQRVGFLTENGLVFGVG